MKPSLVQRFNAFVVCFSLLLHIALVKPSGVNYDPYKDGHHALTLREDMHQIALYFDAVRTTDVLFNNQPIGPYIRDAGLQTTLGINCNLPLEPQIQSVLHAAYDSKNYVRAIMVGNENIRKMGAAKIKEIVIRIKRKLGEHGKSHVLVGTAQRSTDLLSRDIPGLKDLVTECTCLGANIYPYFSRHDDPIQTLHLQWKWIQQRFPNTRLMLTETGWPSDGEKPNSYGNHATNWDQARYFERYRQDWFKAGMPGSIHSKDMYFFQFFDAIYKLKLGEPLREGHFGLVSVNGQVKHPTTMRIKIRRIRKSLNDGHHRKGTKHRRSHQSRHHGKKRHHKHHLL